MQGMKVRNQAQFDKARKMMPEVMSVARGDGGGKFMGPKPAPASMQRYAKGGKVHSDAAMDRKLISKMIKEAEAKPHKEGKKMAHGGKAKGYAAGGAAKTRRHSPTPKPPRKGTLVGGIK